MVNLPEPTSIKPPIETISPIIVHPVSDLDYLRLRTLAFEAYAESKFSEAAVLFTRAIDNFWLRRRVNTMCIELCVKDRPLVSIVGIVSYRRAVLLSLSDEYF